MNAKLTEKDVKVLESWEGYAMNPPAMVKYPESKLSLREVIKKVISKEWGIAS